MDVDVVDKSFLCGKDTNKHAFTLYMKCVVISSGSCIMTQVVPCLCLILLLRAAGVKLPPLVAAWQSVPDIEIDEILTKTTPGCHEKWKTRRRLSARVYRTTERCWFTESPCSVIKSHEIPIIHYEIPLNRPSSDMKSREIHDQCISSVKSHGNLQCFAIEHSFVFSILSGKLT